MNYLQLQDTMNTPDVQIWDNAAFDNGEPISLSASGKENHSPVLLQCTGPFKSPAPIEPLRPNGTIGNVQTNPLKIILKTVSKQAVEVRDEKKIDAEIEAIEKEIARLSTRLEVLKQEKAEKKMKLLEKRGRVVPAKFMEQKQSIKREETLSLSGRAKIGRRGVSLGPSEILAGVKSSKLGRQELTTPVQSMQSRRKSCFWKLGDIEEEVTTSRKSLSRGQSSRKAVTTLGLKKNVKREDAIIASVQPKKLFREGERSVPVKKPLRPGRMVASRYNQSSVGNNNSALRKRSLESLPESCKEENKRCDRKSRIDLMLPKIRTSRGSNGTPRDSGAAKRVAELVGRKSYFSSDEVGEPLLCQALSFVEDVEDM